MKATTLRMALLSNAVFSALSGLAFLTLSRSIADIIGGGAPILYQVIGGGLLAFAGFVGWTGTRQSINTFFAALISLADLVWVIGTLVLIAVGFGALQTGGMVLLVVIAVIVLFFALRQLQGVNQVYAVTDKPGTYALCVSVDTPVSPDDIWPIIADLPSINRYSPNLKEVILRDNAAPGVDAIRQCTDSNGNTWGEHCKRYDEEARRVEFEFLADEPGFPYPFETMLGGWEVEPNGAGATVNIWFEVTPKYGPAQPIILVLMARNLAESFGEVVAHMTAAARGEAVVKQVSPKQYGIRSVLATCH